ncbi:MAG: FIST signal transduction protein [Myxococcota bacterium]
MAGELASKARSAGARFGFITCTIGVDVEALRQALAAALPGVPFVGVTSCRAVIGNGAIAPGPRAASALWLTGDVKAGVAGQSVVVADEAVGRQLVRKATQALGGAAPTFALFHGTPGTEEALLRGAGPELKPGTLLLGGSAADDEIAGKWSVFTHEARFVTGAVLALVSWPGKVAAPWISGATHTPQKGVVTRAQGRTILEIDHRAAAVVYDEWLGGALGGAMSSGEGILSKTSLSPLGVMRASGITLVHPERVVQPTRGLATFAEVAKGETVTLVRSTKVGMQGRPANLVSRAMSDAGISQLKGVLLIYCAGCMLAIDPDTQLMVKALQGVVGGAPIVGSFNFGEQGCHAGAKPEHGNLMTGALLLG